MANYECVRPFGGLKVGDVVDLPGDVSDYYFRPVSDEDAEVKVEAEPADAEKAEDGSK